MIGIDIVDHTDSLLKKRSGKDLRFILHPEDSFGDVKIDDDRLWWLLWSAKEAVFKTIRVKQQFLPRSIQIKFTDCKPEQERGYVNFDSNHVSGKVSWNDNRTIAIATKTSLNNVFWREFQLSGKNNSIELRQKSQDFLPQWIHDENCTISDTSIPFVRNKKGESVTELSLSHHNRVGALMINLPGYVN